MTGISAEEKIRMLLADVECGLVPHPLHNHLDGGSCACGRKSCTCGVLAAGKDPKSCTCGERYCARGNKTPMLSGWQHVATPGEAQLRRWLRRWPDCQWGTVCCNVVVVDVDPRNGGDEALAELEAVHGPLETPFMQLTGRYEVNGEQRRGRHFFFSSSMSGKTPRSPAATRGIDIKAGAANVVIPPSMHKSGVAYERVDDFWGLMIALEIPLPPCPEWLCEGTASVSGDVFKLLGEDEIDAALALLPDALRERLDADLEAEGRQRWAFVHATLKDLLRAGLTEQQAFSVAWGREFCAKFMDRPNPEAEMSREVHKALAAYVDELGGAVELPEELLDSDGGSPAQLPAQAGDEPEKPDLALFGDHTNGVAFAHRYNGEYLFDHTRKVWLRWEGTRWRVCQKEEERAPAARIAKELLFRAVSAFAASPDSPAAKERLKFAQDVVKNGWRLDALLRAARGQPGMGVVFTEFDKDPWMLGVENGVLDLKAGRIVEASREQLITKAAGCAYDPDAKCPQWDKFMSEVFPDKEMQGFVKTLFGYTLSGVVDEEVWIYMVGKGANGKSVMSNVLSALLGEYAAQLDSSLIARDKQGRSSESDRQKARLPGVRAALVNEVSVDDTWDDKAAKEITSREKISARYLHKEAFDFWPTHTLWVRGNSEPAVRDSSDGFWRRMILVDFKRQFKEEEQIPDLDRRIIGEELSGVLNWALEGLAEWRRQGRLRVPASIHARRKQYREETDLVGQWRAECLVDMAEARATVSAMYGSYLSFCQDGGIKHPMTKNMFSRQLAARGLMRNPDTSKREFLGVAVRASIPEGEFEKIDFESREKPN